MPDRTRPSPTATSVLLRRARRLIDLGVLLSAEADDVLADGTRFVLVTAAGDVVEVLRRDMPAYLSGLQHGHRAATHPVAPVAVGTVGE